MKQMILVVLLSMTAAITAQAPIPSALMEAKTVYLVNEGVNSKVIDNTAKAINEWGCWSVAADQAGADMTLTLSAQPMKQVFNWATGKSYPINSSFFSFTDRDGHQLYGSDFRGMSPANEFKKLRLRLEPPPMKEKR